VIFPSLVFEKIKVEYSMSEPIPKELETWKGDFGDQYTLRNPVDWRSRVDGFRMILSGLTIGRVLEIGCNRGHNLVAFSEILGPRVELVGVEPNLSALHLARRSTVQAGFLSGTLYDLPFKGGYFDLVFTCGVLIHVPDEKLPTALLEMDRVTSRYLLMIEYFSEQDEGLVYRGESGLLWKRDFPRHLSKVCKGLTLARQGYLRPEEGFDRAHWWLMSR
jgi:pseudaminic acid biosynthesis-associated methylase